MVNLGASVYFCRGGSGEVMRQRRRCGAFFRDGEYGVRYGEERSMLFEELGEGQNGWSLVGVGGGGGVKNFFVLQREQIRGV